MQTYTNLFSTSSYIAIMLMNNYGCGNTRYATKGGCKNVVVSQNGLKLQKKIMPVHMKREN